MRPPDYRTRSKVKCELLLGLERSETGSKRIRHRKKCIYPSSRVEKLDFRKCDHKITVFVRRGNANSFLILNVLKHAQKGFAIARSASILLRASKNSIFENATTRLPYSFEGEM